MHATLRFAAVAFALCLVPGAHAMDSLDAATDARLPEYSLRYDVSRDPAGDARAAFALATASQRRVLIEVGGEWCRWCHVLDRLLAREPQLAARLHREFVLLKVAIDEDHDAAAVLSAYPATDGYPYLYVVGADGRLIHAQDAVAFVAAGDYSAQRVGEFIERWQDTHE